MLGDPILKQLRDLVYEDEADAGGGETWLPLKATEAVQLLSLVDLVEEAIEKLPGWAGPDDSAHAWWCRVKAAKRKLEGIVTEGG